MPNTSKSSKKATTAAKAAVTPDVADVFSTLFLNNVEQVSNLQKQTLNLAAGQAEQWMGAWKQAFSMFQIAPPPVFFGAANQAVKTVVETQKSAIDVVVDQTKAITNINRVRAAAYTQIAGEVSAIIQKSVERSMEAQKKVLEFASQQNKAISESAKKQFGVAPFNGTAVEGPATAMVDTFQRGADAVIEAQKSVLNMASQPFVAAARN